MRFQSCLAVTAVAIAGCTSGLRFDSNHCNPLRVRLIYVNDHSNVLESKVSKGDALELIKLINAMVENGQLDYGKSFPRINSSRSFRNLHIIDLSGGYFVQLDGNTRAPLGVVDGESQDAVRLISLIDKLIVGASYKQISCPYTASESDCPETTGKPTDNAKSTVTRFDANPESISHGR